MEVSAKRRKKQEVKALQVSDGRKARELEADMKRKWTDLQNQAEGAVGGLRCKQEERGADEVEKKLWRQNLRRKKRSAAPALPALGLPEASDPVHDLECAGLVGAPEGCPPAPSVSLVWAFLTSGCCLCAAAPGAPLSLCVMPAPPGPP
ncbi:hypothetical protein P7K49_027479 [Saguinus oedipus]|uniref:Uncharacterized protein n=1 Tax=Saguinus oedipus TaxID=9490 RepID=A0ABQ9U9Z7_SAGOE|nr:hypothetical protein P7K49_027479 [Saguinus oedipus]